MTIDHRSTAHADPPLDRPDRRPLDGLLRRLPARRLRGHAPHRTRRQHRHRARRRPASPALVLGAVQAWALRADRRLFVTWVVATAVGLAVGLAVGATLVGFATGLGDLVLQGAVSGLVVGLAQAIALRAAGSARSRCSGPLYLAGVWAVGWAVTHRRSASRSSDQFTVFGSAGAVTVALLTAVLPVLLDRRTRRRPRHEPPRRLRHRPGRPARSIEPARRRRPRRRRRQPQRSRRLRPAPSVVGGDATDPAFTTGVCAGADVVYFCLNAMSYERWAEEFPPLQRGVLAGAARPARGSSCSTTCTPTVRPAAGGWSRPCRPTPPRRSPPPGPP